MTNTRAAKLHWVPPKKMKEIAEFRYQLRRFLSFSEGVSEAFGIPGQQYQLLQVVATIPEDEEATISYLAARMMLRHNSAVELVDRAERSGLVRRVFDERDHRRSLVEMTERGGEVLTELVAKHLGEIERRGPALQQTLERLIGVGTKSRDRAETRTRG